MRWPRPASTNSPALGVQARDIQHVTVPGALEGACGAQGHGRERRLRCADRAGLHHPRRDLSLRVGGQRGGAGVSRVSLDQGIAVANAILTVENEAQAWARASDKGPRRGRVAVEMATCWTICHERRIHPSRSADRIGQPSRHRQVCRPSQVHPPPFARAGAAGPVQWLVGGGGAAVIEARPCASRRVSTKCDRTHFDALLHGCITEAGALDAALARHVDRRTTELSPVEHAVLMIGA